MSASLAVCVRGGAGHRPSALLEPGREEPFDLAAAARPLEACAHDLVLDDDERRHRPDAEPFDEIRALALVDPVQLERAVVSSALEHLREEALGAAARSRDRRVEEDQPRLVLGGADSAADGRYLLLAGENPIHRYPRAGQV